MRLGLGFLVGLLFCVSNASGQEKLRYCYALIDDKVRLQCYDETMRKEINKKEVSNTLPKTKWKVTKDISLLDDSVSVHLSLFSDNQTNCKYRDGSHHLFLSCIKNTTSVLASIRDCHLNKASNKVAYRIESESPREKVFDLANGNESLGLYGGKAVSFIKDLFGHSKLIVRITPAYEGYVTSEYNIAGLEEAIKPLREACNW